MSDQSGSCCTLRSLDWYSPHRHRLEGMSANCVHFSSLKSKHSTLRIAFGACPPMTSKTCHNIMRHFDILYELLVEVLSIGQIYFTSRTDERPLQLFSIANHW